MSRRRFSTEFKVEAASLVLDQQYPQQALLSTFDIARSSYRYHCQKATVIDEARDALTSKVVALHSASRGSVGSRTIAGQLNHMGYKIGRYKVRSLMKAAGLVSKQRKRHRYRLSKGGSVIVENHLDRQFAVDGPNQAWCGDVTYVWSGQRWLYLAVVLDLYKRKVVGWACLTRPDSAVTIKD